MPIEIEKKYRLTKKQRDEVVRRLKQLGAQSKPLEFEINTLYSGGELDLTRSILRLRTVGRHCYLTFKERIPSRSDIKHQREEEARVDNPEAMDLILDSLGFTAALVYEKRRERWQFANNKIVIDELPFGLFMEIESDEESIRRMEAKLAVKGLRTEHATYPQLTLKHGKNSDGIVEARFTETKRR